MKYALLVLLAVAASAEVAPLLKAKERIEGKYIIKVKDDVDISLLADNPILSALGGRTRHQYKRVLHGFSATLPEAALNFIRNSGLVEYVEEDGVARKAYSWGIDRVNQHDVTLDNNCAYSAGNEGEGANVFVIDTGVSPDDPDFGGRVFALDEADFIDKEKGKQQNGIDCDGHGTHCSGTVGSNSYGIAKKAHIYGVRVLNCQGMGSWEAIIGGCDYVANSPLPLKVASLSLGGGVSTAVNDAIQGMIDSDVAVAVAAGNENADACNSSPASAPNLISSLVFDVNICGKVGGYFQMNASGYATITTALEMKALTVGATDHDDSRAYFSNYGNCVDIFAPGVDIESTTLNGGRESWSGTSMATPHVAGVMALARSNSPTLHATEIMDMVIQHADQGLVADPVGSPNYFLYCP